MTAQSTVSVAAVREAMASSEIDAGLGSPPLTVVVIAVGAPASLKTAVASLLSQDPCAEIVVVNTGGGGAGEMLAAAGLPVRVLERRERLNPGAGRNLGLRAASGEYVAFLASDCQATPGWCRQRLVRHRAGALSVGSALLPTPRDSAVAWASHLTLFVRRLPQARPGEGLPYGASFHRSIFERYGVFREDMRTGEDTEFAARLPRSLRPRWAPDVITLHESPTRLGPLLSDLFRRGRRASASWRQASGGGLLALARQAWYRTAVAIGFARRIAAAEGPAVLRAIPLIPFCAAAYCLGLVSAPRSAPARRDGLGRRERRSSADP